jgi:hypothetical protein
MSTTSSGFQRSVATVRRGSAISLGKSAFNMIDEIGAPSEPLDAQIPASFVDGVIDERTFCQGSAHLIGEISRSPRLRYKAASSYFGMPFGQ